MNLTDWHKAEGTIYPSTLDKETSEKYVIIRRNVIEVERDETIIYQYDEKMIPRDEWQLYEDIVTNYYGVTENGAGILDVADLADENATGIEELAEIIDDLSARVEALEG